MNSANLSNANLQGAKFVNSNVSGTDFENANVTTLMGFSEDEVSRDGKITDFSECETLTQEQLESMHGDWITILPDHLERPHHWIKKSEEQPDLPSKDAPLETSAAQSSFSAHAQTLIASSTQTIQTSNDVARIIETATRHHRALYNEVPDDLLLVEEIATTLRALPNKLSSTNDTEETLKQLTAQIEALTSDLNTKDEQLATIKDELAATGTVWAKSKTAFFVTFATGLGGAAVVATVQGVGQLVGAPGQEAVSALWGTLKNMIAKSPPPGPPTLPPGPMV